MSFLSRLRAAQINEREMQDQLENAERPDPELQRRALRASVTRRSLNAEARRILDQR